MLAAPDKCTYPRHVARRARCVRRIPTRTALASKTAERALERFHDRCNALAAADALCCQRVAAFGAGEQRRSLARNACAGGAKRVSEREPAPVEVYFGRIEAQLPNAGERLRRECFVDLDHIERGGL